MDQILRDSHCSIIGRIRQEGSRKYIYDNHGNKLGYFDGKYTYDSHGNRRGEVDLLTSFFKF